MEHTHNLFGTNNLSSKERRLIHMDGKPGGPAGMDAPDPDKEKLPDTELDKIEDIVKEDLDNGAVEEAAEAEVEEVETEVEELTTEEKMGLSEYEFHDQEMDLAAQAQAAELEQRVAEGGLTAEERIARGDFDDQEFIDEGNVQFEVPDLETEDTTVAQSEKAVDGAGVDVPKGTETKEVEPTPGQENPLQSPDAVAESKETVPNSLLENLRRQVNAIVEGLDKKGIDGHGIMEQILGDNPQYALEALVNQQNRPYLIKHQMHMRELEKAVEAGGRWGPISRGVAHEQGKVFMYRLDAQKSVLKAYNGSGDYQELDLRTGEWDRPGGADINKLNETYVHVMSEANQQFENFQRNTDMELALQADDEEASLMAYAGDVENWKQTHNAEVLARLYNKAGEEEEIETVLVAKQVGENPLEGSEQKEAVREYPEMDNLLEQIAAELDKPEPNSHTLFQQLEKLEGMMGDVEEGKESMLAHVKAKVAKLNEDIIDNPDYHLVVQEGVVMIEPEFVDPVKDGSPLEKVKAPLELKVDAWDQIYEAREMLEASPQDKEAMQTHYDAMIEMRDEVLGLSVNIAPDSAFQTTLDDLAEALGIEEDDGSKGVEDDESDEADEKEPETPETIEDVLDEYADQMRIALKENDKEGLQDILDTVNGMLKEGGALENADIDDVEYYLDHEESALGNSEAKEGEEDFAISLNKEARYLSIDAAERAEHPFLDPEILAAIDKLAKAETPEEFGKALAELLTLWASKYPPEEDDGSKDTPEDPTDGGDEEPPENPDEKPSDVEKKIEGLKTQIEEHEKMLEDVREELDGLLEKDVLSSAEIEKIGELNKRIDELRKTIDRLKQELEDTEKSIEEKELTEEQKELLEKFKEDPETYNKVELENMVKQAEEQIPELEVALEKMDDDDPDRGARQTALDKFKNQLAAAKARLKEIEDASRDYEDDVEEPDEEGKEDKEEFDEEELRRIVEEAIGDNGDAEIVELDDGKREVKISLHAVNEATAEFLNRLAENQTPLGPVSAKALRYVPENNEVNISLEEKVKSPENLGTFVRELGVLAAQKKPDVAATQGLAAAMGMEEVVQILARLGANAKLREAYGDSNFERAL